MHCLGLLPPPYANLVPFQSGMWIRSEVSPIRQLVSILQDVLSIVLTSTPYSYTQRIAFSCPSFLNNITVGCSNKIDGTIYRTEKASFIFKLALYECALM